jgi:hypothetical protein
MTEEEIFYQYFKCPLCFFQWNETSNEEIENDKEKVCEFCQNKPTSLQLLHRQVDILEKCDVADFPKVLRHLLQHIDLH